MLLSPPLYPLPSRLLGSLRSESSSSLLSPWLRPLLSRLPAGLLPELLSELLCPLPSRLHIQLSTRPRVRAHAKRQPSLTQSLDTTKVKTGSGLP